VVPQRQLPEAVLWNANVFSICTRWATEKLSLFPGVGLGFLDFGSQHVPVQLEAIGLQTANGDSTIISTPAVTSALCSATAHQPAFAIAFPAPSFVFAERVSCVVALQFRDQVEHVIIEFRLRHGQCRVAANQHPRGCVRRKAIEIRIAQDFNSLLGFLQQAALDRFEAVVGNTLRPKNAAT
jgi:hypothetical protein